MTSYADIPVYPTLHAGCGNFTGVGTYLFALSARPASPAAEVPCPDFLITSALVLPGGGYELCVQANDQAASQSWEVLQWSPGVTMYGTGPNVCWAFTGGSSIFTIYHYVQTGGGLDTCFLRVNIQPDSLCRADIVSAVVEDCDLKTTIGIDLSGIATPYVITFGDGSLAV